jgi:hypothetical protein
VFKVEQLVIAGSLPRAVDWRKVFWPTTAARRAPR